MLKFMKACALAAIFTLGMLGCFATQAAAQQDGKMNGTLIDFDGGPMANMPVKIKGASAGWCRAVALVPR